MLKTVPALLTGAVLLLLLAVASASAQAPGLPRTYDVQRIDSPNPTGGGAFGWGTTSADLTGDGKHELLVAQAQTGPGQVFVFDGATGRHIDTIDPPEKNPLNPTANNPDGVESEEFAFVYVEVMPDVGSCPGGDGPDPGKICDAPTVGAGDTIPEILIGSRSLRVNATDGSLPPTKTDPRVGRGYIFDGATRAVLKRIDMPAAERVEQGSREATSQFARSMSSASALPPCAGTRSQANDAGVGPCPSNEQVSPSERIGDVGRPSTAPGSGPDGQPDIIITARNYRETIGPSGTAASDSQCRAATTGTCTAGKVWAYSAAIAGTSPEAIDETPIYGIQNPRPQTDGAEFGGNIFRIGDVGGLAPAGSTSPPAGTPTAAPDTVPDFVIPARTLDYPLAQPQNDTFPNIGAAFLFDGRTGKLVRTITHPEPQPRAQFGASFNAGRAVGDVGSQGAADILLPAPLQNGVSTDDGKVWAFNAFGGGGGGEQSLQFATLGDPTPMIGGNFGGSQTGVGDLLDGPENPANEVLIGGFGPFDPNTEASNNNVTDLHFMNVTTQRNLMTIPHPEGARGDGFGVGITPMGDLNGDGFLDFGATAYLANVTTGGDGRAYIFRSNNAPPPTEPPPPPAAPTPAPAPAAAGSAPAARTSEPPPLRAGACTNRRLGTRSSERIEGTLAGDTVFAYSGDDEVRGFQGQDCLDGGAGEDLVIGGDDNDKLVGGSSDDRLDGADGRDQLFGGPGADRLLGDFGRDQLAGGAGNDRLEGGAGNDRLFGESGKDRILVGGGRNEVDAGTGNDSIDARNGERDTVECGRGRDRVRADRVDRLRGCERRSFPRRSRRSR